MFRSSPSTLRAIAALVSRSTPLSPLADRRRKVRTDEVRRRPGREQGMALEVLAHALEYLVDSQAHRGDLGQAHTVEAVQLLAERSRAVFAGCPEVVTLSQRLSRWLTTPEQDRKITEKDPFPIR